MEDTSPTTGIAVYALHTWKSNFFNVFVYLRLLLLLKSVIEAFAIKGRIGSSSC